MKMGGFKRTVVFGLAASALLLASGCRNERAREGQQDVQGQQQQGQGQQPGTGGAGGESGEDTGRQPDDLKQLPDEEGFQSVPDEHEAPSGIGLDGRGGSGEDEQRPRDSQQDD
jgi:hypothetical protein